ncbi:hypothetical protein [Streptomyces mirabilis]|uniref:hypothetical protein n=1 Tax=Streptomyces mirabilis TaxID=68239 RepID=UPI0036482F44
MTITQAVHDGDRGRGHCFCRRRPDAGQRRPGRERDPSGTGRHRRRRQRSGAPGRLPARPELLLHQAGSITLKVEVAKGHTWTGTFTYAAKLSESILVASAEETISGSISYAKTTTVTLGGTWKVPASQKDGWLALGSKGYSFNWERGSYNGGCKWIVSNHGTAKLPALSPYIAHS